MKIHFGQRAGSSLAVGCATQRNAISDRGMRLTMTGWVSAMMRVLYCDVAAPPE
jgi:hypothetical protein